ncbi:MAG: type II toxin-antitoxin system VapC family toxin [Cypionkella sp.]
MLLDTHAFLWLILDSPRLSEGANRVINDPAAELLVSAVTAYEIGLKHRLGKLPLPPRLSGDFAAVVQEMSAAPLAISLAHAEWAAKLDSAHRDPFDRLLAAQAVIENIPIISADPALDALGARRIW